MKCWSANSIRFRSGPVVLQRRDETLAITGRRRRQAARDSGDSIQPLTQFTNRVSGRPPRHVSVTTEYFFFLFALTLVVGCGWSVDSSNDASTVSSDSGLHSAEGGRLTDAFHHARKIVFIAIPGGTARLGSPSSEPGRDARMEGQTTVAIKPFAMSQTEITKAQWHAVMSPSIKVRPSEWNVPMTNITWREATRFCEQLSLKTGAVHRLPSEVEWEYACRAGSVELMSVWVGNCDLADAVTSYHRGDSGKLIRGINASCNVDSGKLFPVGQYPPNRFGLSDMHGSCWEWVSLDRTLSAPPSPLHAPIRGGSAISTNALDCRSANRVWQYMNQPTESIGFRVATGD